MLLKPYYSNYILEYISGQAFLVNIVIEFNELT